jgi:N-methylhydantoinase A
MGFQVGVDVGGTFTDAVSIDETTGAVSLSKVPTTRDNQARGFLLGLEGLRIELAAVTWLVHGTTVGTNATLERNGGKCGMITSRGFRDILDLGRRDRPQLYGLAGSFRPLIPRDARIEVDERQNAHGEQLTALDRDQVKAATEALRKKGVESILVGFLHSYLDDRNELEAAAIIRENWPEVYVTTSASVLGEFRELERFGTAAINAYLQPLIDRYVRRLKDELRAKGVQRDLAIMQANGGIMSAEVACKQAVNTVLSGPAAGVIAAVYISRQSGFRNVVTCDMGGTSFDVGMIVGGEPLITSDRDLDFNLPMRIPTIDIYTVGAGGGSIARVMDSGILQVGPQSAGSTPGPIAYGRGGDKPTVTDANVMLGRLDSNHLLGVDGAVDMPKLHDIFERKLGRKIGQDAVQAAIGLLRVVNDTMAGAIRLQAVQRGHDPREFAIFAFGGAGPLHGVALAREIGIPHVVVPYVPGLTCALGCIVADVRHDFVQTVSRALDQISEQEIADIFAALRGEGEALLDSEQVPVARRDVIYEADMQYAGQTHTEKIRLTSARPDLAHLREQLSQAFVNRLGIDLSNFRARLVNLRVTIVGVRPPLDLSRIVRASHRPTSMSDARLGQRKVWFEEGWLTTPVYDRTKIPLGSSFVGPAIINQLDTTTVIEPGQRVSVDDYANLVVEIRP